MRKVSYTKAALTYTQQLQQLKDLLTKYPNINPFAMGFPNGWNNEPLWDK